jgi:hypothetical protein
MTMLSSLVKLFLVILGCCTTISAATIRTLDGKLYQGQIKLDVNQLIISSRSTSTSISAANLLVANFKSPAGEENSLPQPWTADSIGPALPAAATYLSGVLDLTTVGTLTDKEDSLHFIHRPLIGDGEFSARVSGMQAKTPAARAAVILRDSLAPDGASVAFTINPAGVLTSIFRPRPGAPIQTINQGAAPFPCALKIIRQARRFTFFKSTDNRNWESVGQGIAIEMSPEAHAGVTLLTGDRTTPASAQFDNLTITGASPARSLSPHLQSGVILTTGTTLAGEIRSADTNFVHLKTKTTSDLPIPTHEISRLIFKPYDDRKVPPHRTGVLLANGDFFEGDFTSLTNDKIQISSVLFGISTFAVGTDAIVIVLTDQSTTKSTFLVRTVDGSAYSTDSFQILSDRLTLKSALGDTAIATKDLFQIRRTGGAFDSLADLTPIGDAGVPPAFLIDSTTPGLPLDAATDNIDRAIAVRPGVQLTYELNSRYKTLLITPAIPTPIAPAAQLRFIIRADGKELFHTPPLTSVDDPPTIVLNISAVRQLSLKVESNTPIGASALWADPLLVKP